MGHVDAPPEPGFVLDPPAASPAEARGHFLARLSVECDSWDVYEDRRRGRTDVLVVDARSAAAYGDMHIPGALLLPSRSIDAERVAPFAGKIAVAVVYGWGIGCNAGTKAAARLAALGVPVKELVGGLESWLNNGYAVEGSLPAGVSFAEYIAWHHSGSDGPYRRISADSR